MSLQWFDFVGGWVGGICSTCIAFPADTVKTRLQTQSKSNPRYNGAWHCFRTILREEKFRGLYKGVTSPLLGIAGMNATIFTVNGVALKYYDPNKLINHWWSGCWAGLAQSIIISPVEMIKTQMQIQGVGKQVGAEYRGWRATCKHIFRHAGPQGFLKGIMCCIVRDVPSFGAYFITYEALIGRPNMLNYTGTYSSTDLPKVLFAGGLAGVNSWVITYPADVVKTRIQAQRLDRPPIYNNTFHGIECLLSGYRAEGGRFLWYGVVPTCVRAFPSNAAVFLVWQLFRDTFG